MAVLIGVTPTVHEKFKNYKESSTFRDKTDAELLEYFLDSFEVITCIVELGARTTAAPSDNPSRAQSNSTTSGNRATPSSAQASTSASELQEITPPTARTKLLTAARKSTPTRSNKSSPTEHDSSKTSTSSTARKSTPVQSARKSTSSSSKAKKSTSTSPASCTRNSNRAQTSSPASSDLTALEYARNWRASILERSDVVVQKSSSSSRRKTTQGTSVPSKPPPLAISPIPAVKTERVDPADITQQIPSSIPALVLENARQVPPTSQPQNVSRTIEPDTADRGAVLDQGNDNESYDPASITEALKLQSRPKRRKMLTEKAKSLYEFNESSRKSVAQLLYEAAFHTPTTSSGTTRSTTSDTTSSLLPSTSKQTPQAVSLQALLTSPNTSDHNYSKTRRSAPESQSGTKSNKPFILTIKPVRSKESDVASAILSGKPLSPPRSIPGNLLRSASHATKSTAPKDSTRVHAVAGYRRSADKKSKRVECSVCCRMFETKAAFEMHIKTVSTSKEYDPLSHERIRRIPIIAETSESDTTKFCTLCNTAFINHLALDKHLADGCNGLSRKDDRNNVSTAGNTQQNQDLLDSAIAHPKSGENSIRIRNVSQVCSPQGSSSDPPNSVPEPQNSSKKTVPVTSPQSIAKKRPQSDLFSLTCTMCNQKFCECLISTRKHKSNSQKKPVENTDPLNFPFPFDLDAVSAPDGKENSRHRANNLMLVNVGQPIVPRRKSLPKVFEFESIPRKPKEKEAGVILPDKSSDAVQAPIPEIPCSAGEDNLGEHSSSNNQTESGRLLLQLENAIDTSTPNPIPGKQTTLSFEETRFAEHCSSLKPSQPAGSVIGPENDPKKSLTAPKFIACDVTNRQNNILTDGSKTPTLFTDSDEDIASETESLKDDNDTDDECGFSDSEIVEVPGKTTDTESLGVPKAGIVSDLDNATNVVEIPSEQVPGKLTKEAGPKFRGVLYKLIDEENSAIESGSEMEADDVVTDDELDCALPDNVQESSHNVQITVDNFEDLLRRHKLFDETIANAREDEYRNLCIVDEDDDDAISVSSSRIEDFCFNSDDECSLSDFDTSPGEPPPLVNGISTDSQQGNKPACGTIDFLSHDDEVAYSTNHDFSECDGERLSERSLPKLKAKSLSINVRDSFLSEVPSPRDNHKRWTRSREKPLFCGPCHKHFKNVDSLEKHELKFHSIA